MVRPASHIDRTRSFKPVSYGAVVSDPLHEGESETTAP